MKRNRGGLSKVIQVTGNTGTTPNPFTTVAGGRLQGYTQKAGREVDRVQRETHKRQKQGKLHCYKHSVISVGAYPAAQSPPQLPQRVKNDLTTISKPYYIIGAHILIRSHSLDIVLTHSIYDDIIHSVTGAPSKIITTSSSELAPARS